MAVSVEYVARETAANLWRNRLMTIAAVLTVAVSLSLVGVSLLLRQGVAQATTQWQHGVDVLVFLDPVPQSPTQPTAQQRTVDEQLRQLPYVQRCFYRDQAYDYQEAKRLLDPSAASVLSIGTTPSSWRCVLSQPAEASALASQFSRYPGVDGVRYPQQAIRTMETVVHVLDAVFLVLAIILLLSAAVLILNTIRLAIFARRREVSVMKLVGATNWFIRIPFMFEGIVQGLAGAVVAVLVTVGLHVLLDHLAGSNVHSLLYEMRTPAGEVAATAVLVGLIGVVIGAAGSAIGIRRFLDT
jgi:cell division transport system permease protein